jgi:hypothetical protein
MHTPFELSEVELQANSGLSNLPAEIMDLGLDCVTVGYDLSRVGLENSGIVPRDDSIFVDKGSE